MTSTTDSERAALDFLCGLHPEMTIDGPPMQVAERIFDAVLAERAELLERIKNMERNLEYMRSARAISAPQEGWQAIETAPRLHGQRVLLLRDGGNGPFHAIGYALDGLDGWNSNECHGLQTLEALGYRVTHWMPLPAPPAAARPQDDPA